MEINIPPIETPSWDLSFIKDYPLNDTGDFDLLPATFAMYWAMSATHMNRLFTEADMREFLFRLAIALDKLKLMEKWFTYDSILNYSLKGMQYALSASDILSHFGFQATDGVENGWSRDRFLANVEKGLSSAKFLGVLMNCQIIPLRKTGEDQYSLVDEAFHPEITDKLISNANFFAEDILKLAPKDLFNWTNHAREEKLDEIEDRRKRIASIPEFTLDMIPDDIIDECMDEIFMPEYLDELSKPENKEKWDHECFRLIKLAWLWANDLFIFGEGEVWEVEGVSLNHKDYMDGDGGFHILRTIEDYELKELEPLLKGIGFPDNQARNQC